MAVRTACGLFDVSHMGELVLRGPDALQNLNHLMTNDYSDLQAGYARYSLMCYENGGVVDDLIVYKCSDEVYLVVVNAANCEKDANWMRGASVRGVHFGEHLRFRGPGRPPGSQGRGHPLQALTAGPFPPGNYTFIAEGDVDGRPCLVSRTGYTGEDGFELYCGSADAPALWNSCWRPAKMRDSSPAAWAPATPCGWKPACPSTATSSPPRSTPMRRYWASSLRWISPTSSARPPWRGPAPSPAARVGLKITGRGIAREHCPVYVGDEKVGFVTSGTHCPYLGSAVALAMVPVEYKEPGTPLRWTCGAPGGVSQVIKTPFYRRDKGKPPPGAAPSHAHK